MIGGSLVERSFGGLSFTYDGSKTTIHGAVHFEASATFAVDSGFNEDAQLQFGHLVNGTGRLQMQSADPNAKALTLALPDGGAVYVPVLVIGDQSVLDVNLGLFNGLTEPSIGVIDADADSYVLLGFHADDNAALRSDSPIRIMPSGDVDDYLTIATLTNVPTIFGTGAYVRIGDAAFTSQGLASEGDLMVSGKVEVDGVALLDGGIAVGDVTAVGWAMNQIGGAFTSDGSGTSVTRVWLTGILTGAAGDTTDLSVLSAYGSTVTQNQSETIGVVAQANIGEPRITKGSDTITVAAALYVENAPTEGATNAAIYVAGGDTNLSTLTLRGKMTAGSSLFVTEQASALADVTAQGQIWVKNAAPNELWFTDDAGTDKHLAVFDVDNAEMIVTSNQTAVIETANTPHAFTGFSTGTVNDFSFVAGITGAITAYADYSGTQAGTVLATCVGHGLVTNDIITIRGTTNYNGIFQITKVTNDTFYFTDTWAADDGASDFEMGDYLLAGTGTAGEYDLSWSESLAETGAAGSVVLFKVYINITDQTKAGSGRKFANTDRGAVSGGGHITLAVADRIWFGHQSDGTNDLTVGLMDLRLMRLA